MLDYSTLTLIVTILGITVFLHWPKRSKIPGPRGIPFFGNFHQIDPQAPQIVFTEWVKEFGDVYRVRLLGKDVVVLSGYDVIREAVVVRSDAFAGRPNLFRLLYLHDGNFHISFTDFSARWVKLKKLTMNAMKMYGGGLKRLEELSLEMVKDFVHNLSTHEGHPVDLLDDIQVFMRSIVFSVTFGRIPERKEILEQAAIERQGILLFSPAGRGAELDMAPWLRFFPNNTLKAMREVRRLHDAVFGREMLRTKADFDDRSIQCVADALLQYQREEGKSDGDSRLTDREIQAILQDVIAAGTSTSSSALYSFIALCAAHPKLQYRLQERIDDVIGERRPSLADRDQLPLMEAAILELLRYISHVPTSIPHKTTTDVEMRGFFIPKDTQVFLNLWSLHHDPRYWNDPWEFRPDRFLTEHGALVPPDHINRRRVMAFGAGRRVCLGETLAKGRLFLVMTSLLQRFHFLPEADDKLPPTDPRHYRLGLVMYPQRFNVRAVTRDKRRPNSTSWSEGNYS